MLKPVSGFFVCVWKSSAKMVGVLPHKSIWQRTERFLSFKGSSSYLSDNYLRTRKVICCSCFFLFTDSACSQNSYFRCMCHFLKRRQKEIGRIPQFNFLHERKVKIKTTIQIFTNMLETLVLSVSNIIQKFLLWD